MSKKYARHKGAQRTPKPHVAQVRRLSALQKALLVALWLLPIISLTIAAQWLRNELLVGSGFFTLVVLSTIATVLIYRNAAGSISTMITDPDGLRGEFTVHRPLWYTWLGFAGLMIGIAYALLNETHPFGVLNGEWALFGLIALGTLALPLYFIFHPVRVFSIGENGAVTILRRGRHEPLRIEEWHRICMHTAGTGSVRPPRKIVFSEHIGGHDRVTIHLELIISRTYKTFVPGTIVDWYFHDWCEQAGLDVQDVGRRGEDGWIASIAWQSKSGA
jgi:hypothetical protein